MNRTIPKWVVAVGMAAFAVLAALVLWLVQDYLLPKQRSSVEVREQSETKRGADGFKPLTIPNEELAALTQGVPLAHGAWSDDEGEKLVVLASNRGELSVTYYAKDSSNYKIIFRQTEKLKSDGGFYKNTVWTADMNNDGVGEALCVVYLSGTAADSKRLIVFLFEKNKAYMMEGVTPYMSEDGRRRNPGMLVKDMEDAPAVLKQEAHKLWAEAQFDLAVPAPFPDFFAYRQFDGAAFSGDKPHWSVTVLPQCMLLYLSGTSEPVVIRYETIRKTDAALLFEGKGSLAGWEHRFRLSVFDAPPLGEIIPNAETPYYAVIDWSDGSRLNGWGRVPSSQ